MAENANRKSMPTTKTLMAVSFCFACEVMMRLSRVDTTIHYLLQRIVLCKQIQTSFAINVCVTLTQPNNSSILITSTLAGRGGDIYIKLRHMCGRKQMLTENKHHHDSQLSSHQDDIPHVRNGILDNRLVKLCDTIWCHDCIERGGQHLLHTR
eukprot:TRINITY_DN2775_c0_g1_i13.p1 TRINITY_DN2775_c0_g1~~TRINITY_DN2775_c0_g1_i13.p1  ORF type:complete len:153 (+),score=12.34 TRINITY_DN2775_c0_g1_i13:332-790(+)